MGIAWAGSQCLAKIENARAILIASIASLVAAFSSALTFTIAAGKRCAIKGGIRLMAPGLSSTLKGGNCPRSQRKTGGITGSQIVPQMLGVDVLAYLFDFLA